MVLLFQHHMIVGRRRHQDPIPFPEYSVRKFFFLGTETCFSKLCLLPLIHSFAEDCSLWEWIQGDSQGWKVFFGESVSPRCCALWFTHIISNPLTTSHSNLGLTTRHSLPPCLLSPFQKKPLWVLFSYANIPLAFCSFIHSAHIYWTLTMWQTCTRYLGYKPWTGWPFRTVELPHSVSKGSPQSRWLFTLSAAKNP